MFSHRWHVWFNHGMGQTDVYAPTFEEAQREAVAWCRKQMAMVDLLQFESLICKLEMTV